MTTQEEDALYQGLEQACPSELYFEVTAHLQNQEEEITELKSEVSRLEEYEEQVDNPDYRDLANQAGNLTKEDKQKFLATFLEEWSNEYAFLDYFKAHYPDLQFQDENVYLVLPATPDAMQVLYADKVEEYLVQHGCEDTYLRLTQNVPHQTLAHHG